MLKGFLPEVGVLVFGYYLGIGSIIRAISMNRSVRIGGLLPTISHTRPFLIQIRKIDEA